MNLGYPSTEAPAQTRALPVNPNRPASLEEMVGQTDVLNRVRLVMLGAAARRVVLPHILFSGPAGTGKTTLAGIVASLTGATLVVSSGPALRRTQDLTGILMAASGPTVYLIDEIHRLPMFVEEVLYEALEDHTLSVVMGTGQSARAVKLPLSPMVIVGATTRPGALSTPLRDRFGLQLTMQPYTLGEIEEIVSRLWRRGGVEPVSDAATVVAGAAKGVPRLAINLATRVLDMMSVLSTPLSREVAIKALGAFGIAESGLDEVDRRILTALCVTFKGRAVGLDALAQALDLDRAAIQEDHEGNLVRAGLVIRTPSGRLATPAAYELLGSSCGF